VYIPFLFLPYLTPHIKKQYHSTKFRRKIKLRLRCGGIHRLEMGVVSVKLGEVASESREILRGNKRGLPVVGLEHLTPDEPTPPKWDEPNEVSVSAIREMDEGKGVRFDSSEALFADLHLTRTGTGTHADLLDL